MFLAAWIILRGSGALCHWSVLLWSREMRVVKGLARMGAHRWIPRLDFPGALGGRHRRPRDSLPRQTSSSMVIPCCRRQYLGNQDPTCVYRARAKEIRRYVLQGHVRSGSPDQSVCFPLFPFQVASCRVHCPIYYEEGFCRRDKLHPFPCSCLCPVGPLVGTVREGLGAARAQNIEQQLNSV